MIPKPDRFFGIAVPLLLVLGLLLALFVVSNAQGLPASELEASSIRYVTTGGNNSGNDCTVSAAPCATIQHAVGVAVNGDEIRVAEGRYVGTQAITRTQYNTVYTYTQVVYINKAITVTGGFKNDDWNLHDPATYATIIDAQGYGRGVSIVDTLPDPATFQGFTVTGGNYTGLGNAFSVGNHHCRSTGNDCGGGIFVHDGAANLRDLVVTDNIAGGTQSQGGGIYLYDAWEVIVENTTALSNTAGTGGGLLAVYQNRPLIIRDSIFQENTANGQGGGISLDSQIAHPVSIERTSIISNTANEGVYYYGEAAGLYANVSEEGQALTLNRVTFQGNQGAGLGKAIYMEAVGSNAPIIRLDNLLIVGNGSTAGTPPADEDAVIAVDTIAHQIEVRLAHVTAAENDTGGFLYATSDFGDPDLTSVVLTNTLLSGFDDAFIARQSGPNQVTIEHTNTLLHNVGNLHATLEGTPVFTDNNSFIADPMLDVTYHLQGGSGAIDAGIESGVSDDIDGQFRPQAAAPDIGADEFLEEVGPVSLSISGPATVVANTDNSFTAEVGPLNTTLPLTYTWSATGLDDVIHSATLSDTVTFIWSTTGEKTVSVIVENDHGSQSDSYPVTVISAPALSIVKSGPAEAINGSTITYELTVSNSGVAGATGLVITDTVPANVTSVTPLDGGVVTDGVVEWSLANLAGGSNSKVHFQVTASQTIVNDDYGVLADGGYKANGSTVVTTVLGQPALTITKRGPYAAAPGQNIEYVLTITNTGNIAATGVVISDTLPPGANYVSGGSLDGNVVRWEVAEIAADSVEEIVFTVNANNTITNDDYELTADGGFSAIGTESVSTIIGIGTRYVSPGGSDGLNNCTNSAAPCASIQHAVNVANPGEEIRVAAGSYSGSQTYKRTQYNEDYYYTQVVYINKKLTLRGGYTTGDWNTSDPVANPTTIDAQQNGRGVTIVDTLGEPVTLEGFTITGGDYTGLGNADGVGNNACRFTGSDCAGGILIHESAANLRYLQVSGNTGGSDANEGGGIYLDEAQAVNIEYTNITNNSADYGGGLFVVRQNYPLTITHSLFQGNVANDIGGGIILENNIKSLVTIQDSSILSNTANAGNRDIGLGGGIYARLSSDNLVLHMDRVTLQGNKAAGPGKAIYLDASGSETPKARLDNLLLVGNGSTAGTDIADEDAVIAVWPQSTNLEVTLAHVTAADNPTPSFLFAEPRAETNFFVNVVLTNTLVSSFTYGYTARETTNNDVIIEHANTLFHNVTMQHHNLMGNPVFTVIDPVLGDPLLDGTYHLQINSDAIDAGKDADVAADIDGDPRPQGAAPDIGADEYVLAAPAAFGKSEPADDATGQITEPTFSWETSDNAAKYEYCIDSSDNSSCDDSWIDVGTDTSVTSSPLDSGTTYYWQVRAVNSLATVYADEGTWFSFTTGTAPGAFSKDTPVNGAANQVTSVNLGWFASANAAGYEYCYDTTNDSSCGTSWVAVGDVLSETVSGLSEGTTYYWQVRAKNLIGTTEADSDLWWSFSTGTSPSAFGKTLPANGATGQGTTLGISWGPSLNAATYEYCVDTTDNDGCNDTWVDTEGSSSDVLFGLSPNTTYYWQVRAKNDLGFAYADNSWWSFTTGVVPDAFSKSAPNDGATGLTTSPDLSWTSSSNAESYEVCYDTFDNDVCNTEWINAGTNTMLALSGLSQDTTYYWQVRAVNGIGETEADSDSWYSFTTGSTPGAFGKNEPANGAGNQETTLDLTWTSAAGAGSYDYCIDTTDNDICDTAWVDAGASTTANVSDLSEKTTYYWQVRAVNNIGINQADSGSWWSFRTVGDTYLYLPIVLVN